MRLEGASALVTGAGRGIGRATALALARHGVRVTAVARNRGELEAVVGEIARAGGAAQAFPADVRDRAACDAAVGAAVGAYGGLQILVNNAGIARHGPLAQMSDDDFAATFDTNVGAVFRLTRAALPHLARQGGHVFMISSLAGQNPIAGLAAYCASKAALDQLSRCLMLEVRQQRIKITTLAPGSVDTGFGTTAGLAAEGDAWKLSSEDVAGAIVDLLNTRDDAHLSRLELRPLRPPKS